ncbi:hypothetical protein A3I53_04010 [Candidatus Curtissbacteria bacterium RIFCSPLOWO2_02_FULL_40_13b]|uniref:NAD kinase n=2 Tax=Candidatus Curtissiibacteriota TaxID=1752717 RepID=A0A1F5HYE7_9BACT|nr:MAG: hypothetical protein A3F45_00215 [Candidatus Curtissbacteria bacterium RIFCSPHIGHO2_12_FULL_41_17]OGE09123.1 MAG: hypothetical protein A3I53_04010 [Candidatus Curtissbacteria bacterium RIFCSPLOWO2_02_FULL_40_13b]
MKIGVVFKEENKDDFKIKSSLRSSSFRTAGLKKAKELASEAKKYIEAKGHKVVEVEESKPDYILSFGGDGTLIHTACQYAHLGIPFIGINVGRLGFLTAAEGNDWQEALDKLIANKVFISERITLEAKVVAGNELLVASKKPVTRNSSSLSLRAEGQSPETSYRAVNEAAIKGFLRIIELEIAVNGEKFLKVLGDGVIISTQTGSTAYSLSSGGPIVDPHLDCLLITPINPIGLPIPSVVISPDDVVLVKVVKGDDVSLIIDGQEHTKLKEGEIVKFTKGKHNVKFGYFDKQHFLKSLNAKFGLAGRFGG